MELTGKRVIELGCGIGLPSVVAANRGASVTATDHYAPALDFAAYNAEVNTGIRIETRLLDWLHPGDIDSLGRFGLILAADVLYERRNAGPLASLIPKLLADDGEVLLADPRRAGGDIFLKEMESFGFSTNTGKTVVLQDGREVVVAVHGLARRTT